MIEVASLSRSFGSTRAVDDVSFRIEQGEVVGLLGPNGAGKSTTMRMICGCIGATSGEIRFDGREIWEAPLEIKSRIGYLPERPPVYDSMTVEAYLRFAARIRGVGDLDDAVENVLTRIGLQGVRERIIGHLSKGYRQRVGLGQALVHDPTVLILDEPSSGLDPEQRKNFHGLLTELARGDRTIILSTHILADVDAVCERVLIIQRGRLVADERIRSHDTDRQRLSVELARPSEASRSELRRILEAFPEVKKTEPIGTDQRRYSIETTTDIREALLRNLAPLGIVELKTETRLEHLYFARTHEKQR